MNDHCEIPLSPPPRRPEWRRAIRCLRPLLAIRPSLVDRLADRAALAALPAGSCGRRMPWLGPLPYEDLLPLPLDLVRHTIGLVPVEVAHPGGILRGSWTPGEARCTGYGLRPNGYSSSRAIAAWPVRGRSW